VKSDSIREQKEKYSAELEKIVRVDADVSSAVCESSTAEDEILIYDNSRFATQQQPSSAVHKTAVESSVVDDEISIYDDSRLAVWQQPYTEIREMAPETSVVKNEISVYDDSGSAVQQHLCSEDYKTAAESVAECDDCSACRQQTTGCFELVSPLQFSDSDSDTKLSRTSSVSSALSLESLVHSAEVR